MKAIGMKVFNKNHGHGIIHDVRGKVVYIIYPKTNVMVHMINFEYHTGVKFPHTSHSVAG